MDTCRSTLNYSYILRIVFRNLIYVFIPRDVMVNKDAKKFTGSYLRNLPGVNLDFHALTRKFWLNLLIIYLL